MPKNATIVIAEKRIIAPSGSIDAQLRAEKGQLLALELEHEIANVPTTLPGHSEAIVHVYAAREQAISVLAVIKSLEGYRTFQITK